MGMKKILAAGAVSLALVGTAQAQEVDLAFLLAQLQGQGLTAEEFAARVAEIVETNEVSAEVVQEFVVAAAAQRPEAAGEIVAVAADEGLIEEAAVEEITVEIVESVPEDFKAAVIADVFVETTDGPQGQAVAAAVQFAQEVGVATSEVATKVAQADDDEGVTFTSASAS